MITFHPSMDIGLGVFNFIYEQFPIQMVYFIIDVYSKASFMSSIYFNYSNFYFSFFISCFASSLYFLHLSLISLPPILKFFPLDLKTVHAMFSYVPM